MSDENSYARMLDSGSWIHLHNTLDKIMLFAKSQKSSGYVTGNREGLPVPISC